ncbi:hypothetical protein SAMN06272775_4593 [Streptomyces sp. 2323.1]|uniref:hypothetical protein n=1 Tax=Streptomyces TaxID=1883 RepID=UPI000BB6D64E|nr:hypothetical protein [Streptomyces sp. 2323.1]SOE13615.1 hypothetical protein SAMN06272775_4593 [Streptomyces sp. 2323.1]
MRTLSFIRWIDGVRTGILSLTAAAPAPGSAGDDTSVTTPAPYGKTASATPAGPAPAAGNGRRTPAPYGTSLLNAPRDTGSSGAAGLRRTGPACPAVRRRPLARLNPRGRFRFRAEGGPVPVPGAGGRLVPAGPLVPKAAAGPGPAAAPRRSRRPRHAPAALPAHEDRDTVPDTRAPQGPVPGCTD